MTESKKPAPRSTPQPGKLPFLMRTRAMGVRGLGAATIGWVLAGCIAFGFVVGSLLDNHFGTSYWMPLMVFIGIAAGFREMFRTLTSLNRENAALEAERRKAAGAGIKRELGDSGGTTSARRTTATADDEEASTGERTGSRQRIFEVPAPPLPSYMKGSGNEETPKSDPVPPEDTEDLIARLLEDEEEPEKDEPDKTHEK